MHFCVLLHSNITFISQFLLQTSKVICIYLKEEKARPFEKLIRFSLFLLNCRSFSWGFSFNLKKQWNSCYYHQHSEAKHLKAIHVFFFQEWCLGNISNLFKSIPVNNKSHILLSEPIALLDIFNLIYKPLKKAFSENFKIFTLNDSSSGNCSPTIKS